MEELNKPVTNPEGPYRIKLTYKGIECHIQMKSLSDCEFDIRVKTNKKMNQSDLVSLKEYLDAEGFTNEARKHNLFW
jgi:hypothetical protein